jgi:hypothetical protein
MAIFASTTTSGYSDPLKAYSIKALEQRQKDMLAQQAQAQASAFSPENTQTPIQGFGQLANVIGDRFQQGRTDSRLAEQKSALAQLIAGHDPENPDMQRLAKIGSLDPSTRDHLLTQVAAAREAKKQREFQAGEHKLTREAAETTASRSDERARTLQAERLKAEKEQKAEEARIRKAENEADPKTIAARVGLERDAVQAKALVSELELAHEDITKGINTGRGSGLKTVIGQIPGVGEYLGDPEQAARTDRFDNTMKKVATTNMSQILKGASTDKEMATFIQVWNSPTATLDQKRQAFGRVLGAAKEDQAIGAAAVQKAGGPLAGPAAAAPTADPATSALAEAQAAIDAGAPAAAVAERFAKEGGDPAKLKPKGQ